MGCRQSKSEAEVVNNEVNREMKQYQRGEMARIKLLLLGPGDSGKTTIFKQMRILYGEGFSETKRAGLRGAIYNNLIQGAQAIVRASDAGVAGRPLSGAAREAADSILRVSENAELSDEIARDITVLWSDANFRATWEARSAFQVLDGWGDFAKQCCKFPEWGGPLWIPSIPDSIRARVRTSGIVEEKFEIDGISFVLVDVGGQRNERRKWIHSFEGVTAVIFVASMSEYDQTLFEAREKNRLQESLELFDQISNAQWFTRTNMVLFLNKSDIFQYKLCERKIPLNASGLFPDAYDGLDFTQGARWVEGKFLSKIKDPNRSVFVHVTNATDTYNVQVVFDACKDALLRDSLEVLGLMHA
jgi:guanine nucleotide-binding protein G(i) subunit alpha